MGNFEILSSIAWGLYALFIKVLSVIGPTVPIASPILIGQVVGCLSADRNLLGQNVISLASTLVLQANINTIIRTSWLCGVILELERSYQIPP